MSDERRIRKSKPIGELKVKITKSQLKQIIKEEIGTVLDEGMSPEAQQLYKQGQEFFGKLIEMGKNDHPEAGDILDALDEWASEKSFEYVRIKSLY